MRIDDEGGITLTSDEAAELARSIVERRLLDAEWWLDWEDAPGLTEAAFDDVLERIKNAVRLLNWNVSSDTASDSVGPTCTHDQLTAAAKLAARMVRSMTAMYRSALEFQPVTERAELSLTFGDLAAMETIGKVIAATYLESVQP